MRSYQTRAGPVDPVMFPRTDPSPALRVIMGLARLTQNLYARGSNTFSQS